MKENKKQIEEIKEIAPEEVVVEQRISDTEIKLANLEKEKSVFEKHIINKQRELDDLTDLVETKNNELQLVTGKLDGATNEFKVIGSKRDNLANEFNITSQQLLDAQLDYENQILSKKDKLDNEIISREKILEDLEYKISKAKTDLEIINNNKDLAEKTVANLGSIEESYMNSNKETSSSLEKLQARVATENMELSKVLTAKDEAKGKLKEVETNFNKISEDIISKRGELISLSNKLDDIAKREIAVFKKEEEIKLKLLELGLK